MLLLAGEAAADGLSLSTEFPVDLTYYHQVSLGISALLPAAWLLFSLSYARGNAPQFLIRWRIILIAALVLPCLALLLPAGLIREVGKLPGEENWFVALG